MVVNLFAWIRVNLATIFCAEITQLNSKSAFCYAYVHRETQVTAWLLPDVHVNKSTEKKHWKDAREKATLLLRKPQTLLLSSYEDSQIIFKFFLTDGPKKIHAETRKSKSVKQNISKGK